MKKEFSDKDLRNILSGSAGASPFKIPESYFVNFPDEIAKQINALPDFEKSSAVNPFSVPENYFSSLPDVIAERIIAGKNRSSFPGWLKNILRPSALIPASLSVAIIVTAFLFFTQKKTIELPVHEFSYQEINNSVYMDDIDEQTLVDFIGSQTQESNDETSYDDYLLDNHIDISQLEKNL